MRHETLKFTALAVFAEGGVPAIADVMQNVTKPEGHSFSRLDTHISVARLVKNLLVRCRLLPAVELPVMRY